MCVWHKEAALPAPQQPLLRDQQRREAVPPSLLITQHACSRALVQALARFLRPEWSRPSQMADPFPQEDIHEH